jgi:hypothetical protein
MQRVNSSVPGNTFPSRVCVILSLLYDFFNVFVLVSFDIFPAVSIKITGLWHVKLCTLVDKYQRSGGICCIYLQGIVKVEPYRWRQKVPQKCWYLPAKLQGVTFCKSSSYSSFPVLSSSLLLIVLPLDTKG